ncbi:MAG: Transglutaminase-like superfamily [Solirubrobacteraceae bacterium]
MRRRERRLGGMRRAVLAAEIVATYVNVRRLLWRHTLPETVAVLRGDGASATDADDASLDLGRHLAWATVRTISVLPSDSRCLMRSLVLMRVLARRGMQATFVLSAAPGPQFEAHAWIEYAGNPLLVPASVEHRDLVRL